MADELAEKSVANTQAQADPGAREILGDGPVLRPRKSRFVAYSEDTRNGELVKFQALEFRWIGQYWTEFAN